MATRPAQRERVNESTRIANIPVRGHEVLFASDPIGLQRTLEETDHWRRAHPDGDALVVLVKTLRGIEVHHRRSFDGSPCAIVLGRHSQCDVDVGDSAGESLRHAAIVMWPAPRTGVKHSDSDDTSSSASGPASEAAHPARTDPIVDTVDLRTATGIQLRDGRAVRRATRSRFFSFTAGRADVIVMSASSEQSFPRFADQLDALLTNVLKPAPGDVELSGPVAAATAPVPDVSKNSEGVSVDAAAHRKASRESVSRVVERSVVFRFVAPASAEGRAQDDPGWLEQTGQFVAPSRSRAPSPDMLILQATLTTLEAGLVVGRYARCDRTAALSDEHSVSRVHALLLFGPADSSPRGSPLFVIDTASTSGTYLQRGDDELVLDERQRVSPLQHDTRLYLGRAELRIELDPTK